MTTLPSMGVVLGLRRLSLGTNQWTKYMRMRLLILLFALSLFLGDADAGLDGEVDLLGMEAGSDDQVPQKSNSQEKVEVRL